MLRTPHIATLAAGAALAVTAGASAAPQVAPTLNGTVGPGFTITLKQNGKTVKKLKAGSYSFVISDRANVHDFVLEKSKGGTFEKELTSVTFTGKKTVKVKLTAGEWEFYCRPHESTMHGDFTVT